MSNLYFMRARVLEFEAACGQQNSLGGKAVYCLSCYTTSKHQDICDAPQNTDGEDAGFMSAVL
jgi:hypothetical protein